MKKLIVFVASLLIAASAHAQVGVIAGLTSSHTNLSDAYDNVKNVTQYHVGVTYKFGLGNLLAVQPSLIYNVKGAKVGDITGLKDANIEFKNGYLELPVQLQVGVGLGPARVYGIVEPFVGCAITNSVSVADKKEDFSWDKFSDRMEYGIGLGAGVELIEHVQVSVRYFWNIGKSDNYKDAVMNAVTTKQASGIVASVALLF